MAKFDTIEGGTPVLERAGVFAGARPSEDAFADLARIRDEAAAEEATRAELAARSAQEAISDVEAIQANLRKFREALTLAYSGDKVYSFKAKLYNEAVFQKNPSYADLASRIDVAGKAEKGQATFYARDNSYAFNVTKNSITHVDANNNLSGQEVNDWYLIAAQNRDWMRSGVTLTGSAEDKAFMKVLFTEILPETTGIKGPKVLNKKNEFTPEIMAQARVKAQQYVDQLAAQHQAKQPVEAPEAEPVSDEVEAPKHQVSGTSGASFMQPLVSDYGQQTIIYGDGDTAQEGPETEAELLARAAALEPGSVDLTVSERAALSERTAEIIKPVLERAAEQAAKEMHEAQAPQRAAEAAIKAAQARMFENGQIPKSIYDGLKDHVQETGKATNGVLKDFLKDQGVPNDKITLVMEDALKKLKGEAIVTEKTVGASVRRTVTPKADFTAAATPVELSRPHALMLTEADRVEPTLGEIIPRDSKLPAHIIRVNGDTPKSDQFYTTRPTTGLTAGEQALAQLGMDQFRGAASVGEAIESAAAADRFDFTAPVSGPALRGGK